MACVVEPLYASCDTGPWAPTDCGYLTTCCQTCSPGPCDTGTGTICPGNVAPAGWAFCDRSAGSQVVTTWCNLSGYVDGDVRAPACAGWRSCRGRTTSGNNGGCVCGVGYCSFIAGPSAQCPGRCPMCPAGWSYSATTGCCESDGACTPGPMPTCPNFNCWFNTFTCSWVCEARPSCIEPEVMNMITCSCECPETAKPACLQVAPYCDWAPLGCGWSCIANDPPPCANVLNCRFLQNPTTLACQWYCDTPSCPPGQTWDPDACICTVNDCPAPPGNCYCKLTGACAPCTVPPCPGLIPWVWNEARCVWEVDGGLIPVCEGGEPISLITCACPGTGGGEGTGTACPQTGGSGTASACVQAGGQGTESACVQAGGSGTASACSQAGGVN